jgi:hypothetical protein
MSEDIFKNYYGKNYEKVKAATPIEIRKMKENFRKKYPNAILSKFDFEITFAKHETVESRDMSHELRHYIRYVSFKSQMNEVPPLGRGMAKRSSGHDFSSDQKF